MPDYLSAFILLVVAGNETTRNSISGGTLALSQFPAEKQKLLDDPSLIGGAVDEIIRWVHPVIYMRRTALADHTLRGVTIKKGDKVALWYMSGNRDEEKWADPFTFNVTRNGTRHLSFGYGQHLCIGWRLAEIQLTVLLEEMLARYPDIEVTGGITQDADELPEQHQNDAGPASVAPRGLCAAATAQARAANRRAEYAFLAPAVRLAFHPES